VPASMVASRTGRFYICFYTVDAVKKGFVIDPENPTGIYFLSTGYDALVRDPLTDKLYVLDGANVKVWNAGSAMTATFKSKLMRLPTATNIGAIQILSKTYPVTLTMWGDGVQHYTGSVPSDTPVRPPGGWRAEELQFEISCAGRVIALRAASTIPELREAP